MMFPMDRERSLLADFNEMYDDCYIWLSLRRMPSAVAPESGDWVELYDRDGDRCYAIVTEVNGPIVTCKMDRGTWLPHVDVSMAPVAPTGTPVVTLTGL